MSTQPILPEPETTLPFMGLAEVAETETLQPVEDTETMPAAAEPDKTPEPEPEPEAAPGLQDFDAEPDPSAALAASVAARIEEVAREVDAHLKACAEADAAYNLQRDADIAARRMRVAAYPTGWMDRIDAYCDEARVIVASAGQMASRRAAA